MDVSLKSSSFVKLTKKYTLCGQCDGKIYEDPHNKGKIHPFYICGCGDIFCSLCHEKHICGSHRHAVQYDNTKRCKSIDFINDLSKLVLESQLVKDLDNTAVCQTPEISFAQLFDEVKHSRIERPDATYSGTKRESISPRISYTIKRKQQYLSDTDDEVFEKSEQSFKKKLYNARFSEKKRATKKRRISTKKSRPSVDSEQDSSNKLQDARRSYPSRANESVHTLIPSIENDITQIIDYNPLPSKDFLSFSVNESLEDLNRFNSNEDNILFSDNLFENVVIPMENETENSKGELKIDPTPLGFDTFESNIDPLIDLDQLNENKEMYKHSTPRTYKPKFYNEKIKQRATKTVNRNRESLRSAKKIKTVEKSPKNCDSIVVNNKRKDFEGFEQSEINASTLNYMLFKLTTNVDDYGEMKFPMCYKGKTIFFHLGKPVTGDKYDNEHDLFIQRMVNVKSDCTQTGDDLRISEACKGDDAYSLKICQTEKCEFKDACIGPDSSKNQEVQTDHIFVEDKPVGDDAYSLKICQTEKCEFKDACIGPDSSKNQEVQTDHIFVEDKPVGDDAYSLKICQTEKCEFKDACIGPDSSKNQEVQTDHIFVEDKPVGPEAAVSKILQTYSYETVDACIGPEAAVSEILQTDSYETVDACIGMDGTILKQIQTDCHQLQDASTSSKNLLTGVQAKPVTSDGTENTASINSGNSAEAKESSDNEDNGIIEGTPVKSKNHSFSGIDALAMKEQVLQFNLHNGSLITRSEVVTCTDLTNDEKEMVKKFTKTYSMEYNEYFTNKTTHLIVSSRLSNGSHKTFKYLMAIASKTYVVAMLWIEESLQAERVLPVQRYIPTTYSGPSRCLMNIQLPFSGLTISSQLLTGYPGVRPMEALCKLCGACIMENIKRCSPSQNWPFPRFCLFENESDLTSEILNICSQNLIIPINITWVFDSIVSYKKLSIRKHLSSTFKLTDNMCDAYKIPQELNVDVE